MVSRFFFTETVENFQENSVSWPIFGRNLAKMTILPFFLIRWGVSLKPINFFSFIFLNYLQKISGFRANILLKMGFKKTVKTTQ